MHLNAWAKYQSATRLANQSIVGDVSPLTLGLQNPGDVWSVPYVPSLSVPSQAEIDSGLSAGVSEVWARIADAPLSAWVIAGELDETIDTIIWIYRNVLLGVKRAFARLPKEVLRRWKAEREGGLTQSVKSFHDARNFWLQLRFGVRPLVYDLLGCLKAIERLHTKSRQRFGYRAKISEVTAESTVRYWTQLPVTVGISTTRVIKLEVRTGILIEPVFAKQNIATLIGVGEVVKGAWDLLPYSFVLDWFCNVGTVITAWSPNVLARPLASWGVVDVVDERTRDVAVGTSTLLGDYLGWPQVEGGIECDGGYALERLTSQRRVPEPPRAVVPTWRFRLSALNLVDLLGLVPNIARLRY